LLDALPKIDRRVFQRGLCARPVARYRNPSGSYGHMILHDDDGGGVVENEEWQSLLFRSRRR
jgi:hypothetical protein